MTSQVFCLACHDYMNRKDNGHDWVCQLCGISVQFKIWDGPKTCNLCNKNLKHILSSPNDNVKVFRCESCNIEVRKSFG